MKTKAKKAPKKKAPVDETSEEALPKSKKAVEKALPKLEIDNTKLQWNVEPSKEQHGTSHWLIWKTECKRYRVVFSVSEVGDDKQGFVAMCRRDTWDGGMWDGIENEKMSYVKYHRDLETALEVVLYHHKVKTNEDVVLMNKQELLAFAESNGIDSLKSLENNQNNDASEAEMCDNSGEDEDESENSNERIFMKVADQEVQKASVVQMFKDYGQSAADSWNENRLRAKVQALPEYVKKIKEEGEVKIDEISKESQELCELICKEVLSDEGVIVFDVETETQTKESKKVKTATKKKASEKKKPEAKPEAKAKTESNGKLDSAIEKFKKAGKSAKAKAKKTTGEVDKFGSRVGSKAASINAFLTKKAKSMKEIMEGLKLNDTCHHHMKKMIEAGHVKKTDDGFALAK